MSTVYKYELKGISDYKISAKLPIGSKVINIDYQSSGVDVKLYLWALVDPDEKNTEEVVFEVYGTGWKIENAQHLDHVQTLKKDGFVWHVFKRCEFYK